LACDSKGGTVDKPKTAEAIKHGNDVIISKSLDQLKVRLQIKLSKNDGNRAAPREKAKTPSDSIQYWEFNRHVRYFQVFQLIRSPHIFEYCHLKSVSPRCDWQQKMWDKQRNEDDIVDDFIELLFGAREPLNSLPTDDVNDISFG
jgi:hypothetical protein